ERRRGTREAVVDARAGRTNYHLRACAERALREVGSSGRALPPVLEVASPRGREGCGTRAGRAALRQCAGDSGLVRVLTHGGRPHPTQRPIDLGPHCRPADESNRAALPAADRAEPAGGADQSVSFSRGVAATGAAAASAVFASARRRAPGPPARAAL